MFNRKIKNKENKPDAKMSRDQKEKFTMVLKDNRDLSYNRFIRVLDEANMLFSIQSIHHRVNKNSIVKDVIAASNDYITSEDTLFKHKQDLGLPTRTRYRKGIPDNFHGYPVLSMLHSTYIQWKMDNTEKTVKK